MQPSVRWSLRQLLITLYWATEANALNDNSVVVQSGSLSHSVSSLCESVVPAVFRSNISYPSLCKLNPDPAETDSHSCLAYEWIRLIAVFQFSSSSCIFLWDTYSVTKQKRYVHLHRCVNAYRNMVTHLGDRLEDVHLCLLSLRRLTEPSTHYTTSIVSRPNAFTLYSFDTVSWIVVN